jgi:phosphoenolpyruvate-protein kinase (PTS system EI component)
LLIGLGATDLSMTPTAIPRVRRALAGIDSPDARAIAGECLSCETADEVESIVRERFGKLWPNLFTPKDLPERRQSN